MVNSTISDKTSIQDVEYPCIMIGKFGTIVFFADKNKGTILYAPSTNPHEIGYYYESWNMTSFTYFNKLVTLKNE